MAVLQSSEETDTHRIILWYGTEVGDVVENPNGVRHPHETRVISGKCRVDYLKSVEEKVEVEEEEPFEPALEAKPRRITKTLKRTLLAPATRPSVDLRAGESIELPVDVPYRFTISEVPLEIQCFYPQGEPAEEVKHLRKDRDRPTVWHLQRELIPQDSE